MRPNRCIYFLTVAIHVVLVVVAGSKLVFQENLRSQVLDRNDGMLISGGAVSSNQLWMLGLRLLQLVDMQAILLHGFSIIISNRLFSDPYSRHLNGMSHLWTVLTVCCLATNLFAMVLWFRFVETTHNTLQESLYGGLELYQFDTTWSEFWNELQMHSRCCGVQNYSDWQGMLWETAEKEAQYRRLLLPDSSDISSSVVIVPISCCRNRHQCMGERINLGVTELVRSVALDAMNIINHAGCFDVMRRGLIRTVRMITLLDAILCSMQLGTIFLMRILFIANRNFNSNTTI
ncbi:uncharacterized protein LOC128715212 [Anopheles marshallii]|uniref:uncharacterized protein LOC128715212 n=1 Tax=Anopheles marshallii TaxID=1521116 RepID=UPI00237A486D|nr:uncharacterized protein LOC128715212 [Anopheles marshallii]